MCVIALQPPRKELSGNKFRNCWRRNSDGGGIAYINPDGKLVVTKGYFKMKPMLREYREIREENPDSPILLHFRIATSGPTDEYNTHPFWVRPDLVVAHNGHLSGYGLIDKVKSDTHMFTMKVLRNLPDGFEDQPGIMRLLDSALAGDKMAFLREDGDFRIVGESRGEWVDGLWFSNSYSYKPKVKRSKPIPIAKSHAQYAHAGYYRGHDHYESDLLLPTSLVDEEDDSGEKCIMCHQLTDTNDDDLAWDLGALHPICIDCIDHYGTEDLVRWGIIQWELTEEVMPAREREIGEPHAGLEVEAQ